LDKARQAEFLRALRGISASLPPFSTEPRRLSGDEARYLQFYGLDLSREFPEVRHSIGAIRSGDYRLAAQVWRDERRDRNLLLVHGYFDHVGLYGHLVRFGLAHGYNVTAFDLPGHGLSSGEPVAIDDFAHYRGAVADVLAQCGESRPTWHVIAQSTGAAAVMDLLQSGGGAPLERVVLLAPLIRPAAWRRVRLAHLLLHRFVRRVPRRFADNSNDVGFLRSLRRDPLQQRDVSVQWVGALDRWLKRFQAGEACHRPLLAIQGDADGTIDWKYNLAELKRLFPLAEIAVVEGARHHLSNESARLRSKYLGLVSHYLETGSLPARRHFGAASGGGKRCL